jgi:transposase
MQPSMPAAVLVALDLSRTSWVVALRTSGDDRVSTHKLRPGDVDRLLELIERSRVREEQRVGGPVQVRSCYEAGYDGFWLHRRLRAAGVRNVVVEPTSLLVDRRARRVKTDRIDAGTLLRALVADARGDRGVWRLVRVPTPEQEEAKRLHRERRRLVRERVAHTNRIRGLLASQGIFDLHPLRDGSPRAPGRAGDRGRPAARRGVAAGHPAGVRAARAGPVAAGRGRGGARRGRGR